MLSPPGRRPDPSEMSNDCDLLIAVGEALFRDAASIVLDAQEGLRVVASLDRPEDVVREADRCRPDVILLEADLQGCDTMALTRELEDHAAESRVLLLTERGDVGFLIDALDAGVRGFISREAPLAALIEAVRRVKEGERSIPDGLISDLVDGLISRSTELDEARRLIADLTPRERVVLSLLADGGNNGSIAEALYISPFTARTHIQNVITKLGVHSRLEAAMFVAQNGLRDELATPNG